LGAEHSFSFLLEYYKPNCDGDINSGHYIFIPLLTEPQVSHLYSPFSKVEAHQGKLASEFAIVY